MTCSEGPEHHSLLCSNMTTARAMALLHSRYYDIDDFLADEEPLPCTTMFDFALLAHLKADDGSAPVASSSFSSIRDDVDNNNNSSATSMTKKYRQKDRHLAGNTKLQMPIWALREWSRLNYVKIKLPKKYSSAARDAAKADPLHCEFSPSYFRTGKAIVQMLINSPGSPMAAEADELQQTLLLTYTGPRLAKTLDWALSAGSGDDISDFLSSLTTMERRLYESGSSNRKRRRLT